MKDRHKLVSFSSKVRYDALVQIFYMLKTFNPKFELFVAYPEYLERVFEKSIPGVHLLGSIPQKKLHDEYVSDALCTLYPTAAQESYGYIFSESNALSVPVITNDNPGSSAREVLHVNNDLLPHRASIQDFAKAVWKVYKEGSEGVQLNTCLSNRFESAKKIHDKSVVY